MDRESLEIFLIRETRLLDERRFREWMDLFTEDGIYWVPAAPGQESPHDRASLFYDDRQLMKTRVERLEHPLIHVQTPPSQTVHLLANVLLDDVDEAKGECTVSSSVIMVEYRLDRQRIQLRSGDCVAVDRACGIDERGAGDSNADLLVRTSRCQGEVHGNCSAGSDLDLLVLFGREPRGGGD